MSGEEGAVTRRVGDQPAGETLTLTVVLRGTPGHRTGLAALSRWADRAGVTVHRDTFNNAAGTITISGPAQALAAEFGVRLGRYERTETGGHSVSFRHWDDAEPRLPDDLTGVVTGVLGFSTKPIARPHMRVSSESHHLH